MVKFPETELILTPEGRVYHLNLRGEDIADNVIVVGDQNRVATISSRFSKIEFTTAHREFITHTGIYEGKRITVLSSGIGTDNIDIVLNELDAAVNIDPNTRTERVEKRRLNIIRLGTSGALQQHIPVNALVASSYGLGLDGLLNYYGGWKSINENPISEHFMAHTQWPSNLAYPYCVAASDGLLAQFSDCFQGITATAPGFYGPQGRQLRLAALVPDLNEKLTAFSHGPLQICNFEMETSAIYGMGKILGHQCLALNAIVANRIRKEFSKDSLAAVRNLIKNSLEILATI